MKKWVVLSCTPTTFYDFFLPISLRLWRKRIGYEPVVVLIGSKEEDWSSGHAKVVYDEIPDGVRIEFFRRIPGIPDSAVAMSLRQHVTALEFDPDDLILIGDVDLFPVERSFYHQYDPSKNAIGAYYADTFPGDYIPAHGVSMSVRNWREVMGVTVGDFWGSVKRIFTLENVKALGMATEIDVWDMRLWMFDERFVSLKIKNSRFSGDVAAFPSTFGRKYPHRVKLPIEPYASDYVDFHCSRPGWTPGNWPDIRFALAQMIPEDLRWVDGYVEKYLASLDKETPSLEATYLDWDSSVFEVNVGLLKVSGVLPRTKSIVDANNGGKVDVVFVKADGWHTPEGAMALDYTYEMELTGRTPSDDDVAVVECRPPRAAHIDIARSAFLGSRFYRDPFLFGRANGCLYEKWLHGNGIVYALESRSDDGFLFVSVDPDGVGRISLIAVAEQFRGTGVAVDLVYGVMSRRRDLRSWRVRVNARNVRAIRLYEGIGFRMKSVQTAFHVWPNRNR